jgi:GntR family transcriptional regulator
MQICIDKQSEVPARDQLRQQIIFLIGTGQLSIGMELPSVRHLARRLKVHHNTISHVYSQLTRDGWLKKKRGSRLVVGQIANSRIEDFADLDDLIDRAIRLARSHGYSLQQLTARVRGRLLVEPSDHLLIVAPERDLAALIRAEIGEAIGHQPDACSASMLQQNPSIAIGAILITPSYFKGRVQPAVSADRTVVPISYSPADEHIAAIRNLSQSSAIGVVSVSALFLETANGLLAPAIGKRHSFREFLLQKPARSDGQLSLADYIPNQQSFNLSETWRLPDERFSDPLRLSHVPGDGARELSSSADLKGFDLLFCDSLGYAVVKHRKSIKYRLISEESLSEIENIANAMLQLPAANP